MSDQTIISEIRKWGLLDQKRLIPRTSFPLLRHDHPKQGFQGSNAFLSCSGPSVGLGGTNIRRELPKVPSNTLLKWLRSQRLEVRNRHDRVLCHCAVKRSVSDKVRKKVGAQGREEGRGRERLLSRKTQQQRHVKGQWQSPVPDVKASRDAVPAMGTCLSWFARDVTHYPPDTSLVALCVWNLGWGRSGGGEVPRSGNHLPSVSSLFTPGLENTSSSLSFNWRAGAFLIPTRVCLFTLVRYFLRLRVRSLRALLALSALGFSVVWDIRVLKLLLHYNITNP